jgi:hypothetical protein
MEDDCQPINFWFDNKVGSLQAVIQAEDALKPGTHTLNLESITQAQDWRRVAHPCEFLSGNPACALGWRVGSDPLWMLRFNLHQLVHQLIVFKIADDR